MPLDMLTGFVRPPSTGGAAPYSIARSLRFNSADSAYLNFTPGASNRDAWTLWIPLKRAGLGITATLLSADSTSDDRIYFNSSDQLCIDIAGTTRVVSTQVFRDPAAWGTLRVVYDAANGTAANRLRVFHGPTEITAWGTDTRSGITTGTAKIGHTVVHNLGRRLSGTTNYFDGYLVDVAFKASADAAWCGQTDATTGQFLPTQPTGALWWLPFSDNSGTTSTTLGKDGAGSNNWTPNNFSVAAGVGNDSLTDTPTNNFCVMNAIYKNNVTLANGGLDTTSGSNATGNNAFGTFFPTSGLWYFEHSPSASYTFSYLGVGLWGDLTNAAGFPGNSANVVGVEVGSGTIYRNNASQGVYTGLSAGDIGMVAWDCATGKVWMGRNGTWFNSGNPAAGTGQVATIPTLGAIGPMLNHYSSSGTISFNFGQRTFSYTPPAGFSSLCTSNLPTPAIVKPNAQFNATLYTGNGSYPRSITGVGHQPDLVWVKTRSSAYSHVLYDSVRGTGTGKMLSSDTTSAEGALSSNANLTSFDSDGFSVGSTGSTNILNDSGPTRVAWTWKKGVTPGFDIATWTQGSPSSTVSHSLGVAPSMMLLKERGASGGWVVWHKSLASATTSYLILNTTAAVATGSTLFNSTAPTSSNFTSGTGSITNGGSGVAYLFAEVAGFSKFGSYTGNGNADGPFVHCGFRPRWVLVKRTDTTSSWYLFDTARDPVNVVGLQLNPDLSNAEANDSPVMDILSNGFKRRSTGAAGNASGGTYIFAAFAEFPFKYANAR